MSRYERQVILSEVGESGQARIAAARALVIGAGGLAATLLPQLAGAGIGAIRIFDPDTVALSNLHRQTLFQTGDIGGLKAEVAAQRLEALNPDCRISTETCRFTPDLAEAELMRADIVIDTADNFATTYALSDACQQVTLPLISASVLGRRGYVGAFCGGGPSYRAVFPDLPASSQSCSTAGVMGPAVATLGALQAQMALAVLLGAAPSPLGQLLTMDLATWRLGGFRFDDAPEPDHPTPHITSARQLRAEDLIIDLRDTQEKPLSGVPGAQRLRPAALCNLPIDRKRRVVLVCSSGFRAWKAARQLSAAGHPNVAILADPV